MAEIVESDPPWRLGTVASGDPEETGTWDLEQREEVTAVRWIWSVRTHRPLLNFLGPIAKPLFAWSHDNASAKGRRGLKKLLERNTEAKGERRWRVRR